MYRIPNTSGNPETTPSKSAQVKGSKNEQMINPISPFSPCATYTSVSSQYRRRETYEDTIIFYSDFGIREIGKFIDSPYFMQDAIISIVSHHLDMVKAEELGLTRIDLQLPLLGILDLYTSFYRSHRDHYPSARNLLTSNEQIIQTYKAATQAH
jgi:hypothetical protein